MCHLPPLDVHVVEGQALVDLVSRASPFTTIGRAWSLQFCEHMPWFSWRVNHKWHALMYSTITHTNRIACIQYCVVQCAPNNPARTTQKMSQSALNYWSQLVPLYVRIYRYVHIDYVNGMETTHVSHRMCTCTPCLQWHRNHGCAGCWRTSIESEAYSGSGSKYGALPVLGKAWLRVST